MQSSATPRRFTRRKQERRISLAGRQWTPGRVSNDSTPPCGVLTGAEGTEQAVRRGIGLLQQSGLSAEAKRTGHELAGLLDTVNGLQAVAAELRTALANAD